MDLEFTKVWLVETVTYDTAKEVTHHQPLMVYATEARARERAAAEVRETVVSELWLAADKRDRAQ